jgi:hypothetical protein
MNKKIVIGISLIIVAFFVDIVMYIYFDEFIISPYRLITLIIAFSGLVILIIEMKKRRNRKWA